MTDGRIELGDVLNLFEYEKVREERRRRVMEMKRARRVSVGRYLSFVFENRDTVLFRSRRCAGPSGSSMTRGSGQGAPSVARAVRRLPQQRSVQGRPGGDRR